MGIALNRLAQEDRRSRAHRRGVGTDDHLGMGELHLEIIVDRMKREFASSLVGKPQSPIANGPQDVENAR